MRFNAVFKVQHTMAADTYSILAGAVKQVTTYLSAVALDSYFPTSRLNLSHCVLLSSSVSARTAFCARACSSLLVSRSVSISYCLRTASLRLSSCRSASWSSLTKLSARTVLHTCSHRVQSVMWTYERVEWH